jgi:heme A synthase
VLNLFQAYYINVERGIIWHCSQEKEKLMIPILIIILVTVAIVLGVMGIIVGINIMSGKPGHPRKAVLFVYIFLCLALCQGAYLLSTTLSQ